MSVKPLNKAAEQYLNAMDAGKAHRLVKSCVLKYASCGYLIYFAYLVSDFFLRCMGCCTGTTSDWQHAKNALIGCVSDRLAPQQAEAWADEILSSCYQAQLIKAQDLQKREYGWIPRHVEKLAAQREGRQVAEAPRPAPVSVPTYRQIREESDAVFVVVPTAKDLGVADDHYRLVRGD